MQEVYIMSNLIERLNRGLACSTVAGSAGASIGGAAVAAVISVGCSLLGPAGTFFGSAVGAEVGSAVGGFIGSVTGFMGGFLGE